MAYHNPRKAPLSLFGSPLLTDVRTHTHNNTYALRVRYVPFSRVLDITSGFRGRSIYRLSSTNDRLVDEGERESERKRKRGWKRVREEEREGGSQRSEGERKGRVKALTAVVRVCLPCGHLLPTTPGGWPCPSVFGERLSFDRRQTARRPKRDLFPPVDSVDDSADRRISDLSPLFFRFVRRARARSRERRGCEEFPRAAGSGDFRIRTDARGDGEW